MTPEEVKNLPRTHVWDAISVERKYQSIKHGEHPHGVAEWLLILEEEIAEAKKAWVKGGDIEALTEVLQVATVAVACMEQHGVFHAKSHAETLILHNSGAK